jgi:hypothetical protein
MNLVGVFIYLFRETYLKVSKYGLNLNVKKTKVMIVSKNPSANLRISVNGAGLERVQSYKYLGCMVNERWDHSQEIKCRIEQARGVFIKMQDILTNKDLSLDLKMRIVRCYVFPVLLYGMEAWTLTNATERRLQAFELWVYRKILKIHWTDRVQNEVVLRRMKKGLELLDNIKTRKLQYFGHIMRGEKYRLLQLIIQGKIKGRRGPGRRRISWLRNLRQWYGRSTTSLFRAAVNKVEIALMIANLRRGDGT